MMIHFESTGSLMRCIKLDMKFSTISELVCNKGLVVGIEAIRAWDG